MISKFLTVLVIVLLSIAVVIFLAKFYISIMLEKRIKKFCVLPIKDDSIPLINRLENKYIDIRNKLTKKLNKTTIFNEYSRKYEKYNDKSKIIRDDNMNYISDKILFGLLCLIIIIIADIFNLRGFDLTRLLAVFLIGFFIPDFIWKIKDRIRTKQIEKDMFKAIIIMNNSFKSGLSIMQAIYMVSHELDGPISEEFKKMYIDINFGLDMNLVFKRFADRVKTDDAKYISSSLTVLNKTGGNIVEVFASVERSSFTRKKLKEEMNALAASSKAIFRILEFMPLVLCIIILVLNPKYFLPLFTTTIGIFIIFLILLIYISYIVIVRKVIKIEE